MKGPFPATCAGGLQTPQNPPKSGLNSRLTNQYIAFRLVIEFVIQAI